MSLYPKWLLAVAGVNLLALLVSVFFLFGGLTPFGTSEYKVVRFLLYLCTNLLWVVPVLCFFGSLTLYGRGRRLLGVGTALLGWGCLAASLAILFA